MRSSKPLASCAPNGFTLVEILIVVVILGILAAIVVPQFTDAARTTRQNTMREDLRYLRTQILVYSSQHNGQAPGVPSGGGAATEAMFVSQLTGPTDVLGNIGAQSDATYKYGPYLSRMPVNPLNGLATIRIVGPGAFPTEAAGTHGWVYQPSTLTLACDAEGTDENNVSYIDY